MNISQLEYFLAASRTLNFTQAANQMFTSRQNLSHAIRYLEKELGVRLFAQEGNSLVLTVAGHETARRAQKILDEIVSLKEAFQSDEGKEHQHLKVALGQNSINCAPYDLPSALKDYDWDVSLSEYSCKQCYEAVIEDRADLALIDCMERDFPACESSVILSNRFYLLASKDSALAEQSTIRLVDLSRHRIVLLPDYEFQLRPFIDACLARGVNFRSFDVISNIGFMLMTVRNEDAVGIGSAAFEENTPPGTRLIGISDFKAPMNLYAVHKKSSPNAASARRLISHIQENLHADKIFRTQPAQ